MKIAVPVHDEALLFFGNAGHTPYFAVYSVNGAGMFKSFTLESMRKNPRTDLEHHHHDDETHECNHGSDDEAHIREHETMAAAIEDCDYLVVNRACKNTVKSMQNLGIAITKCDLKGVKADAVLANVSAALK